MTKTNIQWADRVWNPVVGCSHSGMKGCDNCYAKELHDARYAAWAVGRWPIAPKQYHKSFKHTQLLNERLDWPLHWRKPARIFVNSMSDLFHPKVPFEFIRRIFENMEKLERHTFIVLTKRIKRALEFWRWCAVTNWPKNVWLLASASTQEEMEEAAEYLWKIPAAVRGFSFEPLLEMLYDIPPFDWYIIGCESGPKRRLCKNEWIQGIVRFWPRDADVACFVKQIDRDGKVFKLTEKNKAEWPEWAVQEYPNETPNS